MTPLRAAALWALAAVVAWSAPAHASSGGLRLTVTETLTTELRGHNSNERTDDDDYGALINRLNLTGSVGGISTLLRLDGMAFARAPDDGFADELTLERLRVGWDLGDVQLTAGDFYKQLGRGILLSVRKVDEAGLDVSLRGGDVSVMVGAVSASVFAGRANPANLDAISQKAVADTDDIFSGFNLRAPLADWIDLDLFGVALLPSEQLLDSADGRDRSLGAGASLELRIPGDWAVLYLEGDGQRRRTADQGRTGKAAYAQLDVFAGDWAFLFEGILLDDMVQRGSDNTALGSRFVYNQPPTLERIDQEVFNHTDVRGGRLRTEYSALDGDLLLHANATYRQNDPERPSKVDAMHAYGGLEWSYEDGESRVQASGGFRDERQDGERVKSIAHVEADWVQWLTGRWSLHIVANDEERSRRDIATTGENRFRRGSLFGGLDRGGWGGLTLELGLDTEKPTDVARNHFLAGHLVADCAAWLQLRATLGTQRGGIKCISGVCRDFPAFAGARLETIARY